MEEFKRIQNYIRMHQRNVSSHDTLLGHAGEVLRASDVNTVIAELTALRAQVSALQKERDEAQALLADQDELRARYYRHGMKEHAEKAVRDLAIQFEVLQAELAEEKRLHKHWKDQHANEVKRARIIKAKGDLPLQRIRAYELMGELQGQVAALTREVIYRDELSRHNVARAEASEAVCEELQGQVERSTAEKTEALEGYLRLAKDKTEAWEKLDVAYSERDQLRAEVERLAKRDGMLEDMLEILGVPEDSWFKGYSTLAILQDKMEGMETEMAECKSGCEDCARQHTTDLSTSYEKGAESMRERAAEAAEGLPEVNSVGSSSWSDSMIAGYETAAQDIAEAIRALPLKENDA